MEHKIISTNPKQEYEEQGMELTIYDKTLNRYLTLNELTNDYIKDKINMLYKYRSMYITNYPVVSDIDVWLYIYNDVIQKRRFEKIKRIKDKIRYDG